MKKQPLYRLLFALCALAGVAVATVALLMTSSSRGSYTGSKGCRSCHEVFYRKWSTSHHGLAMQPYSPAFARTNLIPQEAALTIAGSSYRYLIDRGIVRETSASGLRDYPVAYVLGGKNVYYLLTPLERGRLQVLPTGYDVRKRAWFDVPGSAVEHFGGRPDLAVEWTDRFYTCNTACYGCHVSQLATKYDLAADAYRTTWTEPGINCETCHGPGAEHVRVCLAAPTNRPPKDLKIIITKTMTHAQRNDMCSPCHARMMPLTASFVPGDRFFDHYDLTVLDHPDFYPDGRDFGENYTLTTWLLNPCARSGNFDCVHCHTSSGRYRFAGAESNNACMPCHEARVKNATAHTHHAPGGKASECVSCHMPMTPFANMRRSDHSMRPPMPEAALRFGSTIACLLCHTNETPAWTLRTIREWHPDSAYPAPTLHWAGLIDAARRGDWSRLPEMVEYVGRTNREEVVAAGLLRLLASCPDRARWPAATRSLASDPSPLVRAAAVDAMAGCPDPAGIRVLLRATADDYRLVRVRAASALAGLPRTAIPAADRDALDKATKELETSLNLRPDDAGSWYNLGNYHTAARDVTNAVAAYGNALRLRSDFLPALVNLAMLQNSLGRNSEAERLLRKAAGVAPTNAAVNLNLGLLLGEEGRPDEAAQFFLQTVRYDPSNAVAAYNLGVICSRKNPEEAVRWSAKAAEWNPGEARYAYTHAFYLLAAGRAGAAAEALRAFTLAHPEDESGRILFVEALVKSGRRADALQACREALRTPGFSAQTRAELESRARDLEKQGGAGTGRTE